jgi:glucose-1-phosphate cytidylyltransferase
LENLAKAEKLQAFKHTDFWMAMDTLREKLVLQNLWESGSAPWKVWNG